HAPSRPQIYTLSLHDALPIFDRADAPLPEAEALGVGVVHPEDLHALLDPVLEVAAQFVPEVLPIAALEVDRVDILVLLGRVLGVDRKSTRLNSSHVKISYAVF